MGIWLGFRKFNFHEFMEAFLSVDLMYFFASMFIVLFTVYLRAWRWKYLVMPIKKIGVWQLFKMEMVGYFGNNVFPLKMGEILRAYTLGKYEKIPVTAAFGTIVNERLLDTLVFAFFIGLGLFIFPDFPEWIKKGGIAGIVLLSLFAIIVIILNTQKLFVKDLWEKLLVKHKDKKTFHSFANLVNGLTTLFKTPHILMITVQSLIIWLITIAQYWVLGMCLNVSFSVSQVVLIFLTTSAVFAVPAAPGYVGTYHLAAINILIFLGLAISQAQVLAVIMHGVGYLSMTSIGLIFFLKYHIHVNEVEKENLKINIPPGD
ncbi:MAG: flippase-like domain-containing protein [Candidatus Marinimicrobia bacterium]|nr:flippase-like domain-containing protein [Candidatus Neomarinimicrobiota bacterium]